MSDIGSYRLNPLSAQNAVATNFDQVQSFYIQKMSDFGFQGFEDANSLNINSLEFTSKSENNINEMNQANIKQHRHLKFNDQFSFQKRLVSNRLSALNRSTTHKTNLKTDIELIPNFEDKIKYLNKEAKQLDKLQKFIDVHNLPKRTKHNRIKPIKSSVSARYYSSSLIICKFI